MVLYELSVTVDPGIIVSVPVVDFHSDEYPFFDDDMLGTLNDCSMLTFMEDGDADSNVNVR